MHWTQATGNFFTFIPDTTAENPEQFTIATDMLNTWAEASGVPVIAIACSQEQAAKFADWNSPEEHRLKRITPETLRNPVLLIDMGDGTHTLVDGTHRYIVAAFNGVRRLPARLVPFGDWQAFVVTGLPEMSEEMLRTMHSGIL